MSDQITTAFVEQFRNNVTMLAQQQGSRLRGSMREVDITGKAVFMEQMGPTQAQRVTTRHADSPLINTEFRRRRLTPIDIDWGDLVDDFDRLKLLIEPTDPMAQNAAWAIGREIDDIGFEKFFSVAYTGEEGNTQVSFPASQKVDGTLNEGELSGDTTSDATMSGLNIDKLQAAREILEANEVDLDVETPHIALPAKALMRDMLSLKRATNADFATVRALVNGEIDTFMGFRFIRSERVPKDNSGNFRLPVWVPSGMGLAVAKEPTARIEPRPDKRFSTYVYYASSVGASRLEEEKVVEIPVHKTNKPDTN